MKRLWAGLLIVAAVTAMLATPADAKQQKAPTATELVQKLVKAGACTDPTPGNAQRTHMVCQDARVYPPEAAQTGALRRDEPVERLQRPVDAKKGSFDRLVTREGCHGCVPGDLLRRARHRLDDRRRQGPRG